MEKRTAKLILFLFLLAIAGICTIPDLLEAAWWQQENLPLPAQTEEVKKETRKIDRQEFDMRYYISRQRPEEIRKFYEGKLSSAGWSKKEFSSAPAINGKSQQLNRAAAAFMDNVLLFEKNNNFLVISILPGGAASSDGSTRFNISRGAIPTQASPSITNAGVLPMLTVKPKKRVMPEYPQARLITLSEGERFFSATYTSQDSLEQVASFFKNSMPSKGWKLDDEDLPKRVDFDSSKIDAQNCPSCRQGNEYVKRNLETIAAQQEYVNNKGYTCNLVITEVTSLEQSLHGMHVTTILINYNEDKD